MQICRIVYLCALLCAVPGVEVRAAVGTADANHLVLTYTLPVRVSPGRAYAAAVDIAHWWSADHTYSGNAANLHMDAKAGGCFCEKLANGGGVQHMTVVFALPGNTLRMTGGLGPLQSSGATGSLTLRFIGAQSATRVEMTYAVGGYVQGGADKLAAPVNAVLTEQLQRFKSFVDTGKPTAS
jgi:hypothetical protein